MKTELGVRIRRTMSRHSVSQRASEKNPGGDACLAVERATRTTSLKPITDLLRSPGEKFHPRCSDAGRHVRRVPGGTLRHPHSPICLYPAEGIFIRDHYILWSAIFAKRRRKPLLGRFSPHLCSVLNANFRERLFHALR